MHDFVNNQDKAILEVVPVPSTFTRDPLLRLKKRMEVIVELKVVRKELGMTRAAEAKEEVEEKTPRAPLRRKGKGSVERFLISLLPERGL